MPRCVDRRKQQVSDLLLGVPIAGAGTFDLVQLLRDLIQRALRPVPVKANLSRFFFAAFPRGSGRAGFWQHF